MLVACTRATAPAPRSPQVEALLRLHDAVARGTLEYEVAPVPLARAELLRRLAYVHDSQEEPAPSNITEAGLRRALDDIDANARGAGLAREFARAVTLLGNGRCHEVRALPLPDALAAVPTVRASWPTLATTALHAPIARLAARSRAGVFRCEGGPASFQAVFVPKEHHATALVVARLEAVP